MELALVDVSVMDYYFLRPLAHHVYVLKREQQPIWSFCESVIKGYNINAQ
jgi:hypothetical protein